LLKRSGLINRFELENLEPRILLSADAALVAPYDLPEDIDAGTDLLPLADEVAIGDQDGFENYTHQNATNYDPSQSIDDIFSGLTETDLIDGDDAAGDPGDIGDETNEGATPVSNASPYEDALISSHQQEQIVRGLEAMSRLGRVLEGVDAFAAPIPRTTDTTIGEFIGFGEILDTRLAKPVYDYFNDAVDPPDSRGMLRAIDHSSIYHNDVNIAVDSLDGGMRPDGGALQFDVELFATRKGEVYASRPDGDVNENSEQKHNVIAVTAELRINVGFGLDVDHWDDFFVVFREFDAALTAESKADDTDTDQETVQVPPENAKEKPEPDVRISASFNDTIADDGRITLDALNAITDETAEEFVDLEVTGALFLLLASSGPRIDSPDTDSGTEPEQESSDSPNAGLPTFTSDIGELKYSILDTFGAFDHTRGAVDHHGDFDTPLPVIDLSINQMLAESPESGSTIAFDFYTPALEYFTLVEAFNFDLTDEQNLSRIGSLPEIDIPDFSLYNPAHKDSIKNLVEGKIQGTLSPDWDIGLFLPEIWPLFNEDFRLDDYLPQFQLLLGLPYLPKINNIRSDLKSLFGSSPSLKGLLNYIETTRIKPLFNGFSGQHSSEPFLLSGAYVPESNGIQIEFTIDAEKEMSVPVDLEGLFPDRFRALGISFDTDLMATAFLAVDIEVSFSISAENISFAVGKSSVAVRVNQEFSGLGAAVVDFPGSRSGFAEGRFDFDSRTELIFHGLDPPSAESDGTLSVTLAIVSDNPVQPPLHIRGESDNPFDPAHSNVTLFSEAAFPFEVVVQSDTPSDLTLRLNPDNPALMEVIDAQSGLTVQSRPLAQVSRVVIIGSDRSDDTLTIDLTQPFHVPGGIRYDGGDGWFDVLNIDGQTASAAVYRAWSPSSGSIQLDELTIEYYGLEPITDTGDVAERVLGYTAGADVLDIEDAGGLDQITVNADTAEDITVSEPSTSLTIDADDGDDTINFDLVFFSTNVIIDGGPGNDTLDLSGRVIPMYVIHLPDGSAELNDGTSVVQVRNVETFTGSLATLRVNGIPDWVSQGPGPMTGGLFTGIGPDNVTGNPGTGAIDAIAVDPNEIIRVFVATVGGGVWQNSDRMVHFLFDQTDITPAAEARLNEFLVFMRQHPTRTVTLVGHTDDVGAAGFNMTLGQNRANAVQAYLTDPARGVNRLDPARVLDAASRGETEPIASNAVEANGRELNRRVELLVNHWEPLTDNFPSTAIASIAIDPSNSNIIYAGTGSTSSAAAAFPSRATSIGLLKSTDRGNTWDILHRTLFEGSIINDVVVNTDDILLVGTDGVGTGGAGLFRSDDGGTTFTNILTATNGFDTDGLDNNGSGVPDDAGEAFPAVNVTDILVDPGDPTRFYVGAVSTAVSGVYMSTDSGETWRQLSALAMPPAARFTTPVRIELAISATDDAGQRPVYAAVIVPIRDTLAQPITAAQVAAGINTIEVAVIPGDVNATFEAGDTIFIDTGGIRENFTVNSTAASATPGQVTLTLSGNLANAHAAGVRIIQFGSERLYGVFRSNDLGATWTRMTLPGTTEAGAGFVGIHPGGQAGTHFSMVADPLNANVLYIAGDRAAGAGAGGLTLPNSSGSTRFHGRILRGVFSAGGATAWTVLTDTNATNSAPHADSRDMVFQGQRILEADDGGIFRLQNPANVAGQGNRQWFSENDDLVLTEFFDVAFETVNDIIIGGAQDNGVGLQDTTGGIQWTSTALGDGGFVEAAGTTTFFSSQNLGSFGPAFPLVNQANQGDSFVIVPGGSPVQVGDRLLLTQERVYHRITSTAPSGGNLRVNFAASSLQNTYPQGHPVRIDLRVSGGLIVAGTGAPGVDLFTFEATGNSTIQFVQPFELNAVTPTNLVIGTSFVYESLNNDNGRTLQLLNFAGALPLAGGNPFGPPAAIVGQVKSMVYGARQPDGMGGFTNQVDVLIVGTDPGQGRRRPTAANTHALWIRQAGAGLGAALTAVSSFTTAAGGTSVRDVAVDPNDWRTIFVLDARGRIWRTFDGAVANTDTWTWTRMDIGNPIVWNELGPGPIQQAQFNAPPDNAGAGAIEAIAVHPSDPNTVFVGTVAGGVWRTNDFNSERPNWVPLSDKLESLYVGSLVFDPNNANTLYVGTGSYSNTFRNRPNQAAVGLYRTTNANEANPLNVRWENLGRSTFQGLDIRRVLPTTNPMIILAAAADSNGNGGLFLSGDAGQTWADMSDGGDPVLPAATATDVMVDPNNANRIYAAIPGNGVYMSTDTGATWARIDNQGTAITGVGASTNIELAAHDAGATTVLYVGVIDGNGQLSGVFRDTLGGDGVDNDATNGIDDAAEYSWTAIGPAPPASHGGGQGFNNFGIVADPTNANIVYVSGDRPPNIFRGDAAGNTWTSIVLAGTSSNTNPHADSRHMVFLNSTTLLESDDGGVFQLPTPLNAASSDWVNKNGNLRDVEFHDVAFDTGDNLAHGGAQDNGSEAQNAPGSQVWTRFLGGDGSTQAYSIPGDTRYSLGNNFTNFVRNGTTQLQLRASGSGTNFSGLESTSPGTPDSAFAGSRFESLIPVEPNRFTAGGLLIARRALYESSDFGDTISQVALPGKSATDVVRKLVYGGVRAGTNEPNIFWAGTNTGRVYVRDQGGTVTDRTAALSAVIPGSTSGVHIIKGIAVDPQDWHRAWVIKGNRVAMTTDAGASWTEVTFNLPVETPELRDAAFVDISPLPGDGIPVVSGWGGVFLLNNNVWSKYGQSLPNVLIHDIDFYDHDLDGNAANGTGMLLVGTFGRGAWASPNTSTSVLAAGEGGVFRKIGSGPWTEYGAGLPNVLTTAVERYPTPDDILLAGTLGRGAWTIPNAGRTIGVPGTIVIDGTDQAEDFKLVRNADEPWLLDVFVNLASDVLTGDPKAQVPFASIASITINGNGAEDTLTVDLSNGAVAVPSGITFNGAAESDTVEIVNPGSATVVSDTGIVSGGLATTASQTVTVVDPHGDSGTMTVRWTGVETGTDGATVAQNVDVLAPGLGAVAAAFQNGLSDALRGVGLAGVNAESIASALNGLMVDEIRAKDLPFLTTSSVIPQGGRIQLDGAVSVLSRIFSQGGLDLGQVSTSGALATPAALRQALDDLDATPGNVTLDEATDRDGDGNPDIFFEMAVTGTELEGIIDLDVGADVLAGTGRIELSGALEITATVDLNVDFGWIHKVSSSSPRIRLKPP